MTTLALLCPKSKKPAQDMGTYYKFEGYPGVYCHKLVAQRSMSAEEYAAILTGASPQMDKFISKANKPFSAKLTLDEATKSFKFQFTDKPAVALATLCPKSKQPVMDMGTYYRFPGYPAAYFNKAIAQRPMAIEEFVNMLTSEEPIYLDGFISKVNKPFTAALVLDPTTNKINFQFAPRGDAPRATAKAAARDDNAPPAAPTDFSGQF